jgi:hypothetical protein
MLTSCHKPGQAANHSVQSQLGSTYGVGASPTQTVPPMAHLRQKHTFCAKQLVDTTRVSGPPRHADKLVVKT